MSIKTCDINLKHSNGEGISFLGEPIAIPRDAGAEIPLLLRFAEEPVIRGSIRGNTTYDGETPTDRGDHASDYLDDDR
jgi:hypothetical protein